MHLNDYIISEYIALENCRDDLKEVKSKSLPVDFALDQIYQVRFEKNIQFVNFKKAPVMYSDLYVFDFEFGNAVQFAIYYGRRHYFHKSGSLLLAISVLKLDVEIQKIIPWVKLLPY